MTHNIPMVDLKAAYLRQQQAIDSAVARVLASGWYILGEEVRLFEQEFAAYVGVAEAIGVASGTDALLLALLVAGVGRGDEVITVSHTAVATVAAIELAGAQPVLVDVNADTLTLDSNNLNAALTPRTKAIIPVHIYGQAAYMDPILQFARTHGLIVIEDCAQSHGARYYERMVGSMGDLAAFSFYPTKNLGAMGDGGAVVTNNRDFADRVRLLQQYGWRERYVSEIPGLNSRLDELQAAVLRVRLRSLDFENASRRHLAEIYHQHLAGLPLDLPVVASGNTPVYHLFVIRTDRRDELQEYLQAEGIGTGIHYPEPVHRQPAYSHLGLAQGRLPITESAAQTVLSLPMYPELTPQDAERVADRIVAFFS